MATFQNLSHFLRRPRYLRAIPSLMVLTTAMAWGVMPEGDVSDEALRRNDVGVLRAGTASTAPSLPMLPAPRPRD